jgi:DNA mismatch repair protein MutS
MASGSPRLDVAEPSAQERPLRFASLLSQQATEVPADGGETDTSFLSDLNLDQVIDSVAGDREERQLISQLLSHPAADLDTVSYRHEVFRDLQDRASFQAAAQFTEQLSQARLRLEQLSKMNSAQQRQGWFLDAATSYCDAVRALADVLGQRPLASRGLLAFREYLTGYAASPGFLELAADAADRKNDLAKITYQIRIKGLRVEVSRYSGEPDYSAEIEKTFERFQQGAVKDYLVRYRT